MPKKITIKSNLFVSNNLDLVKTVKKAKAPVKKIFCNECEAPFGRARDLTDHMNADHLGLKPFKVPSIYYVSNRVVWVQKMAISADIQYCINADIVVGYVLKNC